MKSRTAVPPSSESSVVLCTRFGAIPSSSDPGRVPRINEVVYKLAQLAPVPDGYGERISVTIPRYSVHFSSNGSVPTQSIPCVTCNFNVLTLKEHVRMYSPVEVTPDGARLPAERTPVSEDLKAIRTLFSSAGSAPHPEIAAKSVPRITKTPPVSSSSSSTSMEDELSTRSHDPNLWPRSSLPSLSTTSSSPSSSLTGQLMAVNARTHTKPSLGSTLEVGIPCGSVVLLGSIPPRRPLASPTSSPSSTLSSPLHSLCYSNRRDLFLSPWILASGGRPLQLRTLLGQSLTTSTASSTSLGVTGGMGGGRGAGIEAEPFVVRPITTSLVDGDYESPLNANGSMSYLNLGYTFSVEDFLVVRVFQTLPLPAPLDCQLRAKLLGRDERRELNADKILFQVMDNGTLDLCSVDEDEGDEGKGRDDVGGTTRRLAEAVRRTATTETTASCSTIARGPWLIEIQAVCDVTAVKAAEKRIAAIADILHPFMTPERTQDGDAFFLNRVVTR